jgi:hypothetical protein
MAVPSSNPGSLPPGKFFPLSETSNEEIGERRIDMNECDYECMKKTKINKKGGQLPPNLKKRMKS